MYVKCVQSVCVYKGVYVFVCLLACLCRVRLLVSAEGTPFELFERVLSPEEASKAANSTHGHMQQRDNSSGSSGGSPGSSSMQLQHSYSSSSSRAGGVAPEVVVDPQLAFAKDRTISRLTEMQSIEYQLQYAKQHAPQLVLALQEMQQQQQ